MKARKPVPRGCPDLGVLLEDVEPSGELAEHVAGCEACAAIAALGALRRLPDRVAPWEQCAEVLPLIAVLTGGGSLDDADKRELWAHNLECAACRKITISAMLCPEEFDDLPEIVIPPEAAPAEPTPEGAPQLRLVKGGAGASPRPPPKQRT